MTAKIVTAEEVAKWGGKPLLLDVRLADDFRAAHLPGAANNCVFEVVFLDRMAGLAPDKAAAICVYGIAADSHESRVAAEKLVRAEFVDVRDFRGGLAEWRESGRTIEGGEPVPAPSAPGDGSHEVDLKESRVEWLGRNLLNKHWGTVALTSGRIEIRDGRLAGGEFVLDMTTLESTDLAGNKLHDVLIAHLMSDDFFDVALFPQARFVITRAGLFSQLELGRQNLAIAGELTLKGVTAPVEIASSAGLTADGKLAAQGGLAIDRTLWNVIYGSSRFFRRLGSHLVNDLIEIQLRIVTK